MSIASAITNLTNTIRGIATTKGQIKSAVNTDIDFIANEQIEQYPNLIRNAINQYKSYIPVVTGEGKQLSLNTVPLKMKEFKVEGDTFQQTYEGKNFADFSQSLAYTYSSGIPVETQDSPITNRTSNSYTITYNKNGYIGVLSNIMNLEPNTNYTISFNRVSNSNFAQRLHILNVSEQGEYSLHTAKNSGVNGTPYTLTFTTGETGKTAFMISVNNSSPSGYSETITNIQVEEGSTATDFEPFVGTIASPNPDYPQPIQVVTGSQTITKRGKNLIDASTLTKGYINADGGITVPTDNNYKAEMYSSFIKVNPNTTYTFSIIETTDTYDNWFGVGQYSSTTQSSFVKRSTMTVASQKYITFTADSTVNYIRVSARNLANATKIMLVEGSDVPTATDYEPYITPIELPLNLGNIKLCAKGTYKDVLFKNIPDSEFYNAELEEGSVYKKNVFEEYIVNNDLTNNSITEQVVSLLTPALNIANNLNNDQLSAISYCNMLQTKVTNYSGLNGTTASSHKIRVNISTDYATTYNEAKQLCADKGLQILFVAEIPTYTKITDETLISQLEAINNLNMNDGTTIIYAENEEGLQPTLYVKAYAKAE